MQEKQPNRLNSSFAVPPPPSLFSIPLFGLAHLSFSSAVKKVNDELITWLFDHFFTWYVWRNSRAIWPLLLPVLLTPLGSGLHLQASQCTVRCVLPYPLVRTAVLLCTWLIDTAPSSTCAGMSASRENFINDTRPTRIRGVGMLFVEAPSHVFCHTQCTVRACVVQTTKAQVFL